jgi:peptidyl-prolyl cis-trans isomerase C
VNLRITLLAAVALSQAGCHRSQDGAAAAAEAEAKARARKAALPGGAPQPSEELGEPLAKVDDAVITVAELQDSINRQSPYVRARYQSREQKKVFLDNLITFEVLAKEAARRGLDRDPEVVQTMKSAMISKLMKAELTSGIAPEDVPEAEIRAYYDAHRVEFDKPEEVRASAIVVKSKGQADTVAQLARSPEGASNKQFRDLVAKHSVDEETRLRGGDLRFFSVAEAPGVPEPVVKATFALSKTGDVGGPVKDADGRWWVLKLTGRRKAVVKSFDQVKRQIQNDLYKDKRESSRKKFVQDLEARAKIQVFEDNLKKVRVDSSGRAATDPAGDPALGMPAPPSPGETP